MKFQYSFILLLISCCLTGQSDLPVKWHNGMQFKAADAVGWNDFKEEELIGDSYVRLITFDHLLSDQEKTGLMDSGYECLEYVSDFAYIFKIRADKRLSKPGGINSLNTIKPAHKLSQSLLYGNSCMQEIRGSRLMVKFVPGISRDFVFQTLNEHAISVEMFNDEYGFAYLTASDQQIQWLSGQASVLFMDCRSAHGEPEDREGRSLHRANMITSNPGEGLFLDGSGVRVMVRDDGFVGPHIDFQGRLTQDVYNDIGTHGDGVSGILTGAGNNDPLIIGMAPGSDLYVINYQPDFLDNTLDFHLNEGVVITNSSYSNGCNIGYTIEAQVVDKQLFENQSLIHVFSAGNSNNQDCGYGAGNQWGNVTGGHKIGKNAFTVANLRLDGTLETSSSRGPTKDGRMKPEISARGTNQLSTAPDNGTLVFGGTSAAAPGIAGICALLYEAYKKDNQNNNPESALIKAAMMNTATDIGTPGPDYLFGFGVVDAYRAHKLIKDKRYSKHAIKQNEVLELKVQIPAGSPLLKFMIYWSEQQSSLMSSKVLINDLDFEVTSPTGTIFRPWTLDPSPNAATLAAGASKGIDTLHNFEQVSISYPMAGEYSIKISGKFLPSNQISFYLLQELEDKVLRLTHPIGGEQFSITERTQVHYTTYGTEDLDLFFSPDAGMNWTKIGTQTAGTRLLDFIIPNNISSDSCLIEIRQGAETDRSGFFTVTNGVQGLKVSKYCIDEMELSWLTSDKDSFLIYQLGQKYMDPIAVTSDTKLTLPNANPLEVKWFSIAGYDGTSLSRRELAIFTPDTLINCGIVKDLGLRISSNNQNQYYSCNEVYIHPVFQVINRTPNEINEFTLHVVSDTGIISQIFNQTIGSFDTLEVELSAPVLIKGMGEITLSSWVELPGDENPFNDSLKTVIQLNELRDINGSYPSIETFSSSTLPSNWIQTNTLDNSRWEVVNVTGKSGAKSNALLFNNPNQVFRNQPIVLSSLTANLETAVEPYLYFDFAHHNNSASQFNDSFAVVVKSVCGPEQIQKVVLEGNTSEIKTVGSSGATNWSPVDSSWYWLAFDLSEFKGTKVIVEFVIIRGHNHRTLIDNFEIREKYPETGTADLKVDPEPACYSKPVRLTPVSSEQNAKYYLDAGLGGSPRYFSDTGTHSTRYIQQGDKRAVFNLESNIGNDFIVIRKITLANNVGINFNFNIISGRTVAFNNTSVNGETYLWDFGDGTISNEFSPVHTFDSALVYRVKLTVENPCGTYNRSVLVDLTPTATSDLNERSEIHIYPNPAATTLQIKSELDIHLIRVFSMDGKLLKERKTGSAKNINLNVSELPKSWYKLVMETEKGIQSIPFEKL